MQAACDPLIGDHDFTSFCRRPKVDENEPEPSMVRRVLSAKWSADEWNGALLRFEIRANAFCHQMVRSIVGLLVDVGRGRRRAGEVLAVLRAKDRAGVGNIAPPHGLCLWEVGYPDGFGSAAG
jgi:tRNA pseudouridine38-40 synthase